MKPLLIDLYCGLGGWSRAFLDEGWDCIGFDIERHDYGTGGYPGQLVLQDVCTLEGRQLADADCIVASSPCHEFSYRAMPWKRAKALGPPVNGIKLFWQPFRLQREIELATGKRVPLVAENVKGAQPWVGSAGWHYGSFYLWGDLPALMLQAKSIKNATLGGGSWFAIGSPGQRVIGQNPDGRKQRGSGRIWFDTGIAHLPSSSPRRKAKTAEYSVIPYPLAQHIARVYKPERAETARNEPKHNSNMTKG